MEGRQIRSTIEGLQPLRRQKSATFGGAFFRPRHEGVHGAAPWLSAWVSRIPRSGARAEPRRDQIVAAARPKRSKAGRGELTPGRRRVVHRNDMQCSATALPWRAFRFAINGLTIRMSKDPCNQGRAIQQQRARWRAVRDVKPARYCLKSAEMKKISANVARHYRHQTSRC